MLLPEVWNYLVPSLPSVAELWLTSCSFATMLSISLSFFPAPFSPVSHKSLEAGRAECSSCLNSSVVGAVCQIVVPYITNLFVFPRLPNSWIKLSTREPQGPNWTAAWTPEGFICLSPHVFVSDFLAWWRKAAAISQSHESLRYYRLPV